MKSKPKAPTQPEATDLNSANKEGSRTELKVSTRPKSTTLNSAKKEETAKYRGTTSVLLESHPRIDCRLVVHMVANGNA